MKNIIKILTLILISNSILFAQEDWQTLNEKVNSYYQQGKYEIAIEYGLRALVAAEKEFGKESQFYAASQNFLALLYQQLEQYLKAEPLYLESSELFKKFYGEGHPYYGQSMLNLGLLYVQTHKYKKAEKRLDLARQVFEQNYGTDSKEYAFPTYNLAKLYFEMGEFDKAQDNFIDAILIYRKVLGQGDMNYITAVFELASLYKVKKEYEKAEQLYKEILEIYKQLYGETTPEFAHALSNLATVKDFLGQYDVAEQLFNRALRLYDNFYGDKHQYYINNIQKLARVFDNKGDYVKSLEYWNQTLDLYLVKIKSYFPALSEEEKGQFYKNVRPFFEEFNSFAVKWYKKKPELLIQMYDNQLSTKALLLNSTSKVRSTILNSGDEKLIEKFNEWISIKEKLATFYTLSKERLIKGKIDINSFEKKANTLERELSKESEIFSKGFGTKDISWKDIKPLLNEDEAAIEIIRFRNYLKQWTDEVFYAALITKSDSKRPELVLIKNGNMLENEYLSCYKNMIKHQLDDYDTYGAYWKDIQEKLTEKIGTIYISLDGAYNLLSMGTIQYPNLKYLIDSLEINIVNNTKILIEIKDEKKKPSVTNDIAMLIGDPNFDYNKREERLKELNSVTNTDEMMKLELQSQKPWDSFKMAKANEEIKKIEITDLPGTEKEINEIEVLLSEKQWKIQKHLDKNAREYIVKEMKSPKFLHIATHGYFLSDIEDNPDEKVFGVSTEQAAENPLLRSGLLLAGAAYEISTNESSDIDDNDNGILTAYEAMNLELDKTELVVLSACETGVGEVKVGEGVYGLQRAFEVAGAKTILMSLWTVNDFTTRELMTTFYKELLKTGDKKEAFKNAQLYMKKKYRWPYYWGPFVMMGGN